MSRIDIIAHRGASAYAMENTLEAFQLAWQQAADGIEGDFLLTADKQIVCFHDLNTKRLLGRKKSVKSLTLKELRQLALNAVPPFYLPTLREVLKIVPMNKKLYIEIKCGAHIIPFLYASIQESTISSKQLMIISFRKAVIRECKKWLPEVRACWLRHLRRSQKTGEIEPHLNSLKMILKEINADGLSTNHCNVTKTLVQMLNKEGFEHHCWTVDKPKRASVIATTGCKSITTNDPKKIYIAFKPTNK